MPRWFKDACRTYFAVFGQRHYHWAAPSEGQEMNSMAMRSKRKSIRDKSADEQCESGGARCKDRTKAEKSGGFFTARCTENQREAVR